MQSSRRIKEIEAKLRTIKHEQQALEKELSEIKDSCRHVADGATLSLGNFGFCSICGSWKN